MYTTSDAREQNGEPEYIMTQNLGTLARRYLGGESCQDYETASSFFP
jgi:hypothetical protein